MQDKEAIAKKSRDRREAKKATLTYERLIDVLVYEPTTGDAFFRSRSGELRKAGCLDPFGYVIVRIDYNGYRLHRLAFLYMNKRWPDEEVDHIDGDKGNNRWLNLRDVNRFMNIQNCDKPKGKSKSGYRGVYVHHNKFSARISVAKDGKRKTINLGLHDTLEEASFAYTEAQKIYHPGFVQKEQS